MTQSLKEILPISISLIFLLSACFAVPTGTPVSQTDSPSYTAAAQTIAAQLTGISSTSLPASVTPAGPTITSSLMPTETLPPTSTPFPTDTPLPTDPPTPTLAPTIPPPSPTISVENPKAGLGEPDWVDPLQDGANWPLYNDEHVNMQILESQLAMTSLAASRKDPWDSWMITQTSLDDFYLEISASPQECQGLDRYGMVARAAADASQAYLFGFSCDGKYSLRLWDGEKLYMIQEWTMNQAINPGPGQVNRLGLLALGDQFWLFANDQLITQVQDETLEAGAFGFFSGAVNTDGFRVLFDQIAYWILP